MIGKKKEPVGGKRKEMKGTLRKRGLGRLKKLERARRWEKNQIWGTMGGKGKQK